jgi:succinate dehydrogenase / fumarate reductase, membrane anchor subunit
MAEGPAPAGSAAKRAGFSGSTKSATSDAWHMRVTSILLVPLSLAFAAIVLSLPGKDYAAVRAELGQPLAAILMLLFILSGVFHMKIGMQSIIDDYVHEPHLKEGALIGNLVFSVCAAVTCIYAVLKLSFA